MNENFKVNRLGTPETSIQNHLDYDLKQSNAPVRPPRGYMEMKNLANLKLAPLESPKEEPAVEIPPSSVIPPPSKSFAPELSTVPDTTPPTLSVALEPLIPSKTVENHATPDLGDHTTWALEPMEPAKEKSVSEWALEPMEPAKESPTAMDTSSLPPPSDNFAPELSSIPDTTPPVPTKPNWSLERKKSPEYAERMKELNEAREKSERSERDYQQAYARHLARVEENSGFFGKFSVSTKKLFGIHAELPSALLHLQTQAAEDKERLLKVTKSQRDSIRELSLEQHGDALTLFGLKPSPEKISELKEKSPSKYADKVAARYERMVARKVIIESLRERNAIQENALRGMVKPDSLLGKSLIGFGTWKEAWKKENPKSALALGVATTMLTLPKNIITGTIGFFGKTFYLNGKEQDADTVLQKSATSAFDEGFAKTQAEYEEALRALATAKTRVEAAKIAGGVTAISALGLGAGSILSDALDGVQDVAQAAVENTSTVPPMPTTEPFATPSVVENSDTVPTVPEKFATQEFPLNPTSPTPNTAPVPESQVNAAQERSPVSAPEQQDVYTYAIQPGDTLFGIFKDSLWDVIEAPTNAQLMGFRDYLSANPDILEKIGIHTGDPDLIRPGMDTVDLDKLNQAYLDFITEDNAVVPTATQEFPLNPTSSTPDTAVVPGSQAEIVHEGFEGRVPLQNVLDTVNTIEGARLGEMPKSNFFEVLGNKPLGDLRRVYSDEAFRNQLFPEGIDRDTLEKWRIWFNGSNQGPVVAYNNETLRAYMEKVLSESKRA